MLPDSQPDLVPVGTVHTKHAGAGKLHSCDNCFTTFKSRRTLMNHQRKAKHCAPFFNTTFICNICNTHATTLPDFLIHRQTCKPEKTCKINTNLNCKTPIKYSDEMEMNIDSTAIPDSEKTKYPKGYYKIRSLILEGIIETNLGVSFNDVVIETKEKFTIRNHCVTTSLPIYFENKNTLFEFDENPAYDHQEFNKQQIHASELIPVMPEQTPDDQLPTVGSKKDHRQLVVDHNLNNNNFTVSESPKTNVGQQLELSETNIKLVTTHTPNDSVKNLMIPQVPTISDSEGNTSQESPQYVVFDEGSVITDIQSTFNFSETESDDPSDNNCNVQQVDNETKSQSEYSDDLTASECGITEFPKKSEINESWIRDASSDDCWSDTECPIPEEAWVSHNPEFTDRPKKPRKVYPKRENLTNAVIAFTDDGLSDGSDGTISKTSDYRQTAAFKQIGINYVTRNNVLGQYRDYSYEQVDEDIYYGQCKPTLGFRTDVNNNFALDSNGEKIGKSVLSFRDFEEEKNKLTVLICNNLPAVVTTRDDHNQVVRVLIFLRDTRMHMLGSYGEPGVMKMFARHCAESFRHYLGILNYDDLTADNLIATYGLTNYEIKMGVWGDKYKSLSVVIQYSEKDLVVAWVTEKILTQRGARSVLTGWSSDWYEVFQLMPIDEILEKFVFIDNHWNDLRCYYTKNRGESVANPKSFITKCVAEYPRKWAYDYYLVDFGTEIWIQIANGIRESFRTLYRDVFGTNKYILDWNKRCKSHTQAFYDIIANLFQFYYHHPQGIFVDELKLCVAKNVSPLLSMQRDEFKLPNDSKKIKEKAKKTYERLERNKSYHDMFNQFVAFFDRDFQTSPVAFDQEMQPRALQLMRSLTHDIYQDLTVDFDNTYETYVDDGSVY
ncbi:MAG: hypothetical protein JKX76_00855 [Colwellia sp.]|nr:hypothetical protein [Colwellia sp.]